MGEGKLTGKELAFVNQFQNQENRDLLNKLFRKRLEKEITDEEEIVLEELEYIFLIPERYLDFVERRELKNEISEIRKSKSKTKKDGQGTARQIAIAFHFMTEANSITKGVLDPAKNARFLRFLSGLGEDTLRKRLSKLKKGEIEGVTSERQINEVLKDLNIVKEIFADILFEKEITLIDKYISKLENDLKEINS